MSVDTSLLIDVQRERARARGPRPAHRFLERHAEVRLAVSAVALGELAKGLDDPDHPLIRLVCDTHDVLPVDHDVAVRYAGIVRSLRQAGELIGANDLWIAATALHHRLPLVTADAARFRTGPGPRGDRLPRLTGAPSH